MQSFGLLFRRYKELPAPVKASFWFTVCNLAQKGIQFFLVLALTRLMSTSDYGRYSVFLSWYQIISIFATLNMWSYTLNNGMLKYESDRSGYISSLQGLNMLITLILFLIYLPFSGRWEQATSLSFTAMAVMFAELLFMPAYEYWCGRERFEYRYKGVVVLTLAVTAAVPLVCIPLVIVSSDKGMTAIVGRAVTSAAIYAVPSVLIAKRGRKFYDKAYWRFALRFVLPLIPHFLSCMVLAQADRIMIARMVGEDKAGIYSFAYSSAMVAQVFNSAIISSFIPYTYGAIQVNKPEGVRRNANYLLALIALLNLALICVAPEAVRILGPEEYREAMYIIPPAAASNLFMFLFSLFANIEYYFGETKFVTMASTGSALINILLNWICIPRFGYIAAGYTTLVCYVLYSLGHYVFMRVVIKKYMDGKRVYDDKAIFVIVSGAVLLSFGLLALYDHPVIRYAIALAAGVMCIFKREWIIERIKEIRRKKA